MDLATAADPPRQALPQAPYRVDTGALKFGDDWTGLFVRGDAALYYARALEALQSNQLGHDATVILLTELRLLFSSVAEPYRAAA